MRTIQDKIIIQQSDKPTKSKGGIIVPDNVTDKPFCGTVQTSAVEGVKPGNIVLYKRSAGIEFQQDGEQYVCITADDILVIL